MGIRTLIKNVIQKVGLMSYANDIRRKRIINQFDKKMQRFKNINRLSVTTAKKYEENIYDQIAERYVYKYMSLYSSEIAEIVKRLKVEIQPANQSFTVFTMWWQEKENMPPVVKACVNSLNKLGEKVVIITQENYADYVSLPDYIISLATSGKMCFAHLSDIIRTFLLVKYGGVWIDSTVYIARDVPDYMTKEFFVFKQSPQLRECRSYGNWWIASPPANDLLIEELAYLYCYWKHHDVAMHYYIYHFFFKKIIDENPEYKNMVDSIIMRITDTTHLLANNYSTQFDEQLWTEMKDISPVFKCSNKIQDGFTRDSFYSRLCNNQLD